jgi:pimeloyl-ACP methyl ester carboxylesterase
MWRKPASCVLAGSLLLFGTGVASSQNLQGWGVVLIHGKSGRFGGLSRVESAVSQFGAATSAPRMSWSSEYRTYDETLAEVDAAVRRLRSGGARRIALIGQSLGANVALGYMARRGRVNAVVAISPGHHPPRFARWTRESIARARQMVRSGQGNVRSSFLDINQGRTFQVTATARAYLSFFDPRGPAVIPRNAGRRRGARLLWVVGTRDRRAGTLVRGGRVLRVPAGHRGAGRVAAQDIAYWLAGGGRRGGRR